MGEASSIKKKIEIARKELLDLGLRNPLLNYRTLKARGLEVVGEIPAEIYRILVSDKKTMSFLETKETKENDSEQLMLLTDSNTAIDDSDDEELKAAYTDNKLQTGYNEKQLQNRLLNTYLLARTYIEEQGVNILYMALGMLHWYESDGSDEPRKAPLLLIPVQLDRGNARERFKITYTEDEIGYNISLAAKMKAEFDLTITPYSTEDDLDVDSYFSEIEHAIDGSKRWSVDRKSIVIGFFSFGKFMMYRDLDTNNWPDHSKLEEHPIIRALLEDGFKEEASIIGEDDSIDPHYNLKNSNHILDADSSQIAAILDANQGKNMVIQGPPGTGKSQTITNLIAESIGAGKKVLFVSEKMAALEVVKRRLDAVGLGVACLELHSHKTNKKTLLSEIANTLDLGKPIYKENENIFLLEGLRTRLNDYCQAMHEKVGKSGVTPYQALGRLAIHQEDFKEVSFSKISAETMEAWTSEEYKKREALIEELQGVIKSIGVPVQHPFWGSRKKVMMPAEIDDLQQMLDHAAKSVNELLKTCQTSTQEINYPTIKNIPEAKSFIMVCKRVIEAPDLKDVQLSSNDWLSKKNDLEDLIDTAKKHMDIHEKYDNLLLPEAWDQDLLEARRSVVLHQNKWWKFIVGDYRKAKNKFLGLCKNPNDKNIVLLDVIEAIMESQRQKNKISGYSSMAKELFLSDWNGISSNWSRISQLIDWITKLHKDIKNETLPSWIVQFLEISPSKSTLEAMVNAIEQVSHKTSNQMNQLTELLEFNVSIRFENNHSLSNQDFSTLIKLLDLWMAQRSKLQGLTSYNNLVSVCNDEKLNSFVKFSESWEYSALYLLDFFRWSWYQVIAAKAFRERQEISQFDGSRHEQAVHKFCELDRLLAENNKLKLAEVHWKSLPQYEAGGQLGVLRREFEKKSRHLPIRQLINRAGKAIQAIKPVFMMGPLSVAAYIQPDVMEFDLVIFDEASQVKPVDAFGAIIRSKQAIVVGDSKQMPPTNFFDTIAKEDDIDDEENFTADMESILGLFAGQNAHKKMLRWHYRSRHESLITVSNHIFYDNKLVVFPSPDSAKNHSGLRMNYLSNSHYDRGRTKTNQLEAKAVALAVMNHAKTQPELTLGVAAFSMAQMQAVMDEIEIMRRADPSCESYFNMHPYEPFFVKNLENVQGDERDVIFISIGYGKTSEGYLSMSFGPLNRDGGERRLNVLITRARIRCEVFTNLRSDDIDLNRSKALGVLALKTYLKYAESGIIDIPLETGKEADSEFEEAVCKAISGLGYEVKNQVGSAGFYIDLAIADPSVPGSFLLGIECDGATYHSSRSARDRDRLRQEVLEGLGWSIHRIWSTDWFREPERELKKVVEAIEKAKILVNNKNKTNEVKDTAKETEAGIPRDIVTEKQEAANHYKMAMLNIHLGGREFHELPISQIASWVYEVVQVESPVHVNEVMKRICDSLGIKRLGNRIREVFDKSFSHSIRTSNIRKQGNFLWLNDMVNPMIRNRSSLANNKKIEFVPTEEIAVSIISVVRESFGIDMESLIPLAYQKLGFVRVTEDMRILMNKIIQSLLKHDVIVIKDDMLSVS